MTSLSVDFQRHDRVPDFTRDLSRVDQYKWSAPFDVPAIGEDVVIRMNQIGRARVVGYATVSGYLGVMAVPYTPPAWWVAQNGRPSDRHPALAFGAEIALVTMSSTSEAKPSELSQDD